MFNPNPQIIWDLTQTRFHGKMKAEDEYKEHSETIKYDEPETNYSLRKPLIGRDFIVPICVR